MRRSSPWSLFVLLVLSLAVAACGGSSGSGLPGGESGPLLPEPEIVTTTPAQGAQDVPETAGIEVEVSEPVDAAAILADHLSVRTSGGPIAGAWTLDPRQILLTFTPSADLPVGAEIVVEMAASLPFESGAARTTPFAFSFGTRAPAPAATAGFLDHTSEEPIALLTASHPTGGHIALYGILRAHGNHEFYSRFRPVGGDYEPHDPVVQGPPAQFARHSLAIDAQGDAAWAYQGEFGGNDLGLLRLYDRQTGDWTSAGLFQSWSNRTMGGIAAARDDQGSTFVAWQETDPMTGNRYVGARRHTEAGGYEDYEYFDDQVGDLGTVRLAANSRGDAAVAWQQVDATGVTSCYAAVYEAGFGWHPQQVIESFAGRACWMRGLVVTPDGHVVALLAKKDGPGAYEEIPHLALYSPAGSPNPGWAAPAPVAVDRGELSDYGLHVTADGTVYAIYSLVEDASYVGYIRAVRFTPLTGTLTPILLSAPQVDDVDSGDLSASVTPGGEILVAWSEQTIDPRDTLKAALVRASGDVFADIALRAAPGADAISMIRVAAGPGGGGMVVWTEPDPANGIDARRLPLVCIAPDGAVGAVTFLNDGVAGDLAESPAIHLDASGTGAVAWIQATLATGHADVRYRLLN